VREHELSVGKIVRHLEYEAYAPMARKQLLLICQDIRSRWPGVVAIAISHRLGVVRVTEASVVIAVSSPHRREALAAVSYAIDTLKSTVPIWKLECYEGDDRIWKENSEWANGHRDMVPLTE
jgi:molybdopterin synthase catalytic subunit